MRRLGRGLPATVFALGLVSFFTDVASELIVPLLPVLLASLGGSMVQLGLLQGVSDGTVSLLKLFSGWLSDRQQRRKPWLVFGYGLSTLLRPCFAFVASPLAAVLVRTGDRVGKGVRSAPRDALLVDVTAPELRGAAFGVQRAMDHAGAVVGGALASVALWFGCELRVVFALALIPGLLAMLVLWWFVREVPRDAGPDVAPPPADAMRRLLPFLGVVVPSAISSGIDLFALKRASDLGFTPVQLPLLWVVLHLVRSTLSTPCGRLSDRIGRWRLLAVGLPVHAAVLLLFAFATTAWTMWPLFAVLGLHAAATEPAERGYVADLTGKQKRGTVFGVYHAAVGVAGLAGPITIGWLWDDFGSATAFASAAGAALGAWLWLLLAVPSSRAG